MGNLPVRQAGKCSYLCDVSKKKNPLNLGFEVLKYVKLPALQPHSQPFSLDREKDIPSKPKVERKY